MDKSRRLMKTVFGLDNGFMRAAERVFDLILLNLLFVLTASLLVTAGVAKIALYCSLVELREKGRLPLVATYLGHVKTHWKQGLILGGIELALLGFTLFDLYLIRGQEGLPFQILGILAYGVLFLTLLVHLYVYPLVAQYHWPLKELYLRAVVLIGMAPLKTLLFLGSLILIGLALLATPLGLLLGLSLLLLIGIASLTYLFVVLTTPLFQAIAERWTV